MSEFLFALNGNKWVAGISMLLLNIGARYLHADLGKIHEMILSNEYVKKLIVFAMFFVATRDVITAFLLTLLYIFIIDGLLHESRKFCIIPKQYIPTQNEIKKEDYAKAQEIIKKYQESAKESFQQNDIYMKYLANASILR